MQKEAIKNKQILDFTYNFSNIVKKGNWVPRYDKESDSLSYTINNLPDDARIKYFGDEIAFYVTKNNEIKGIFIEYFTNNFIKHTKGVEKIKNLISEEDKIIKGDDESLLEINPKKIKKGAILELQNAIKNYIAESIHIKPSTCKC